MKKIINNILSFSIAFSSFFTVMAEDDEKKFDKYIPKVIPPSPNASALGQYGEFPVSLYTGTPNISVPIGTVEGHAIKVPISLSYHASGVKVEQIAPSTGLGWSLNAGGAITRVVRGKADDQVLGYFMATQDPYYDFPVYWGNEKYLEFVYNGSKGDIDPQPDSYIFNFMGYSGKFFIDNNREAHFMPHQDFKIVVPDNFETGEWQIITDDGTIYKFGGGGFTEKTYSATYGETSPAPDHVSAWYLKEISRQDRTDKVTFEYESEQLKYDIKVSTTDYNGSPGCPAKNPTSSYSFMDVQSLQLSKIKVNGKLAAQFSKNVSSDIDATLAAFQRKDLYQTTGPSGTPASALKKIELFSILDDTKPVKQFILDYDHFNSTGVTSHCSWTTASLVNSVSLKYRLKLTGIREVNVDDPTDKKLVNAFTYHDDGDEKLPSRCSMSQDHWGFYNGAANETLLPKIYGVANNEGADRSANPNTIAAGTIKTISYPTGGYTQFHFMPHKKSSGELDVDPIEKEVAFNVTDAPIEYEQTWAFDLTHGQYVTIAYTMTNDDIGDQDSNGSGIGYVQILDAEGNNVKTWSKGDSFTERLAISEGSYTIKFKASDLGGTNLDGTLKYEEISEEGEIRNINYTVSELAPGERHKSVGFVIAKTSTVLAGATANEAGSSVVIRLYKDDIFLKEITTIDVLGSTHLNMGELQPGEYHIEVENSGSAELNNFEINISYSYWETKSAYVGGLKITKIESYDGTGRAPLVKQYQYQDLKEVSPITDFSYVNRYLEQVDYDCGKFDFGRTCGYITRTSKSMSFLGATQGSPVGYQKVTTIIGNYGEKGKVVDEFTYYSNSGGGGFPYPQPTEYQWRSGLLKKQSMYNAAGDIIKQTTNDYEFSPLASIIGQVVAYSFNHPCIDFISNEDFGVLEWESFTPIYTYELKSEWVKKISSTESVYDQNDPTKFVTTTKKNSYKDVSEYGQDSFYAYLKKTIEEDSKGNEFITEYKYPKDESFSEPLNADAETARLAMVSKNIIKPVLEKITSKKEGEEVSVLSKVKTNYTNINGIYPKNIELAPTGSNYESRVTYHKYDLNGNVQEYAKDGGAHNNYIWSYENTKPTAHVTSIESLDPSHGDISYTSFESGDTQDLYGWKYVETNVAASETAKTGRNTFSFNETNPTITKSGLKTDKKYVLTVWAKGVSITINGTEYALTSEWQLIQTPITETTNITITGQLSTIDELRIYPRGAQMTTYSYDPMIGMTSTCDVNNVVTYYEYDSFGRLIFIRDTESNILNKYEYQYGQ